MSDFNIGSLESSATYIGNLLSAGPTDIYRLTLGPNRDDLATPRNFPLPGENNRTITNWNQWRDWRVSINYLEDLAGDDFLSQLPQNIQEAIESREDGLLPS